MMWKENLRLICELFTLDLSRAIIHLRDENGKVEVVYTRWFQFELRLRE
jgi:hypothetical protein